MALLRRFQLLRDRNEGRALDETLYDGVSTWLEHPLREWLDEALQIGGENLARRTTIRMKWAPNRQHPTYHQRLLNCERSDLLTVVDAVIQLHPSWEARHYSAIESFSSGVAGLEAVLIDAGSLYRVDVDNRCLARRVDPTVQDTAEKAIQATSTIAAGHLRAAWTAAYGMHPDPDKAYDEAILAIEDIACPLICPKNTRATLGTVIRDLRSQINKWELAAGDSAGQPASADRFIEMLALLWEGQSRHAGGVGSRQQTQIEAEAAVSLAATMVHWLTRGVLRSRP